MGDMHVDHSRLHALVAEEPLNGRYGDATLEQMRGIAVSQGMDGGSFGNRGVSARGAEGLLERGLVRRFACLG